MSGKVFSRLFLLLLLGILACACATRPDLVRLYEGASDNPDQPPVILIHGLAGSTLVDAKTGKQFWPGSLGTLAFSDFRNLAQMSAADREGEGLIPGDFVYGVAGVDFYGDLIHSLEKVGRFERGVPAKPVGSDRRRYYVLLYDWRKDNIVAVRKLHALIEQIRLDYNDQKLRVDIIAHSNGGLIANYYLRYGANDLPENSPPVHWREGDQRIRRLIMLGTPRLGAVTSFERLVYGTRLGLRTVPTEVMATFATPFQALPHPLVKPILDPRGRPVDLDIYDEKVWREHRWGVYSPEVAGRVRASAASTAEGDRALAELQAVFARNLRRAERLQWALSAPLPPMYLDVALFGGDCEMTPGHAILLDEAQGSRLVFRPGQVDNRLIGEPKIKRTGLDYQHLMFEPGDGLVTRASQVARHPGDDSRGQDNFHMLPVSQSFFLCESHGRLTHNLYFQNNLLYFLLSR
jgi:pimeloyl-ACP methyl ester carboxylesterase